MTDQHPSYNGIGSHFAGGHHTFNHGVREYARDNVTTNTAESFFALLKRGVYGNFHHISRKHLHRYADEFAFRWNGRKLTDGECTASALGQAEGKRLPYKISDRDNKMTKVDDTTGGVSSHARNPTYRQ